MPEVVGDVLPFLEDRAVRIRRVYVPSDARLTGLSLLLTLLPGLRVIQYLIHGSDIL